MVEANVANFGLHFTPLRRKKEFIMRIKMQKKFFHCAGSAGTEQRASPFMKGHAVDDITEPAALRIHEYILRPSSLFIFWETEASDFIKCATILLNWLTRDYSSTV